MLNVGTFVVDWLVIWNNGDPRNKKGGGRDSYPEISMECNAIVQPKSQLSDLNSKNLNCYLNPFFMKRSVRLSKDNTIKYMLSCMKTHSLLFKHLWLKTCHFQKCNLHLQAVQQR